MRKTFLKILVTILVVIVFFIAQHFIRQYYGIDPRIWFFVVYSISLAGIILFFIAFNSEIKSIKEYFKTHSQKIKLTTEKIVNSSIYNLLMGIVAIIVLTGIIYKAFFYEDFMARTKLNIIFIFMLGFETLSYLVQRIFIKKEQKAKNFVYLQSWIFLLLVHLIGYILHDI